MVDTLDRVLEGYLSLNGSSVAAKAEEEAQRESTPSPTLIV